MRVDPIIAVTSYAALIEPESVRTMKTVFVGGKLLKPDVIRRWSNKVRLINVYGPSEAGPVITVHECGPSEPRLGCI
jgi:non-ribosomal peptide synthetase component F